MNSLRTGICSWRAFGKPVVAVALLLLLFVSALASASPALHHYLHQDDQAPSHYCLVTVLEHGQSEVTSPPVVLEPVVLPFALCVQDSPSFFVAHDLMLHPERGPPALS